MPLRIGTRWHRPRGIALLLGAVALVQAGVGLGNAASCAGFTGAVVYSGTVDALTTTHGTAATALPLKTLPDGNAAITVRVRFSVDDTNAAQGTDASTDLVWVADALGDRTPPPP